MRSQFRIPCGFSVILIAFMHGLHSHVMKTMHRTILHEWRPSINNSMNGNYPEFSISKTAEDQQWPGLWLPVTSFTPKDHLDPHKHFITSEKRMVSLNTMVLKSIKAEAQITWYFDIFGLMTRELIQTFWNCWENKIHLESHHSLSSQSVLPHNTAWFSWVIAYWTKCWLRFMGSSLLPLVSLLQAHAW